MTEHKFHPGQKVMVSSGFGRPNTWEGTIIEADPMWGERKALGCYAVMIGMDGAVVRGEEEIEAVDDD